jgi:hypothetical protein
MRERPIRAKPWPLTVVFASEIARTTKRLCRAWGDKTAFLRPVRQSWIYGTWLARSDRQIEDTLELTTVDVVVRVVAAPKSSASNASSRDRCAKNRTSACLPRTPSGGAAGTGCSSSITHPLGGVSQSAERDTLLYRFGHAPRPNELSSHPDFETETSKRGQHQVAPNLARASPAGRVKAVREATWVGFEP